MATTVPVTGLTMLGQQLLQGSADYANRRDEQRRRDERLLDVANNRSYEEGQFNRLRQLQLEDEQRRRTEGLEDAEKKALLANRVAMLQEAQRRGIIAANQLGNQAIEDAALVKLNDELMLERNTEKEQQTNAEQALAAYAQEMQQLEDQFQQVYNAAQNPPKINIKAIKNDAVDLAASRKKPGFFGGVDAPTREEIAAAEQELVAQAQQRSDLAWMQAKENARVILPAIRARQNSVADLMASVQARSNRIAKPVTRSSLVALPAEDQSAPPPGNAPPPGADPLAAFQTDVLGKNYANPEAAPAPITPNRAAAPAALQPAIRHGDTLRLADFYAEIDAPRDATRKRLAETESDLQRIQQGQMPLTIMAPSGGLFSADGMFQSTGPGAPELSPRAQGELATRLLMRKSALEQQLAREDAERLGKKNQALSNLRLNAPTQSAPFSVPSPGSLLSTPR